MSKSWWRGLTGKTCLVMLVAGLSFSISGCDQIKGLTGDSASKDDDSKKKKKKKSSDDEESEEDEADTADSATASAAPPADTAAPADTGAPPPAPSDVTRYPGQETPMGGTVRLKIPFKAYQAADLTSKELASLAPGTFVNLEASFSNWMLIEYPSGIGELSLGWIQLRSATDNKAVETATPPPDSGLIKPDASVPDAAVPDAAVPDAATPDAATATDGGKRPVIKLRLPKK